MLVTVAWNSNEYINYSTEHYKNYGQVVCDIH